MFFFISYNLPNTSDVVSVAFEYTSDVVSKPVLELLNSTFKVLGLASSNLIEAGYIADKPMFNEDIWRLVKKGGEIEKF